MKFSIFYLLVVFSYQDKLKLLNSHSIQDMGKLTTESLYAVWMEVLTMKFL